MATSGYETYRFACKRLMAAAAPIALGTATAPVFAQNANSNNNDSAATPRDDEGAGEVIIVTAQLREQNIQDTPLAISAISGDMLEARSQTNLTEISAQTPSLLLQQNPSGQGNSMRAFIRGVGQSDQSPSVEPGVGIYVDDIYFGTVTASAFDLVDLDRVEVLRGPQGTLAGMNAQGGAIKLYSRQPEGEGGFVEASIGNFSRRDIKASADFTVVPDTVFARITGVTRNQDGYVTRYDYACLNPNDPDVQSGVLPQLASGEDNNCKLGELGNKQFYGIRGALRIAPAGSPLEINVIGDYTKDTSETQASVLIASAEQFGREQLSVPYQGAAFDDRFVTFGEYRRSGAVLNDPYASYANFYDPGLLYGAVDAGAGPPFTITPTDEPLGPFIVDPSSEVDAWGVSGTVDYRINDVLTFKSITGYRTYDSLSGQDNDNSPIVFIQDQTVFEHEQVSQEVRLSGVLLEETVNFTVGGIYYDASTRYNGRIHTPFSGFCPAATPCFSFINDDTSDLTVWAGFGNVAWNVTEKLVLEGGLRVTDERKDYTFGRFNPDRNGEYLPLSNPGNPLNGLTDTYHQTIVDYRAVASYMWTPDIMTYAQFATGHKAGGISPRPYDFRQVRPFPPEKLRSYEIGFKTDLLDRRVRLNGAVYYMDYVDYQGTPQICVGADGEQLPPSGGGIPGLCGQYLAVADATVRGFELEANFEPVDGFNIDAAMSLIDFEFGAPNFPTTSVREGSSRPGIGDFKWSIGAQYFVDLAQIGSLTPRIDVNYTPGFCGNFECAEISRVDEYTLVNARLTYRTFDEDWSVALEAKNLFDKFYFINKIVPGFYATGQPDRPREVALTVRRNF